MARNKLNQERPHGTREWALHNVNCCTGCGNDCRYCYAKSMAVRFGRMAPEEWKNERIRDKDVAKSYRYMGGTVMFPSAHDITPRNFLGCFIVLEKLLKAGNDVLVVSKPDFNCIRRICDGLCTYKSQILYRFTIGASEDGILKFWEPNAPAYEERRRALRYAFDAGFKTSVSVEPMLDSQNIEYLVDDLSPLVTDSIWIGKMNQIRRRVEITDDRVAEEVLRIEQGQTEERIKKVFESLKNNPIVKWKDSIKKVVGIKAPEEPGMDV